MDTKKYLAYRYTLNDESRYKRVTDRLNVIDALIFATDNAIDICAVLLSAEDVTEGKEKLCKMFQLSGVQAQAIVDMRFRVLHKQDRQKLEFEYETLMEEYIALSRKE